MLPVECHRVSSIAGARRGNGAGLSQHDLQRCHRPRTERLVCPTRRLLTRDHAAKPIRQRKGVGVTRCVRNGQRTRRQNRFRMTEIGDDRFDGEVGVAQNVVDRALPTVDPDQITIDYRAAKTGWVRDTQIPGTKSPFAPRSLWPC
jgi:hypothetical protein